MALQCPFRVLPPDVVRELLVRDDAGPPPVLLTDEEGGSPLRCCLRPVQPGERVALASYAPLRRWARETGAKPGPYDETGPVFVHRARCPGPAGNGYPAWMARGRRVLRAYDRDGRILGGRLVEADPAGNLAGVHSALADLLADPHVAVVHARQVEFGCFAFEVRRAGDEREGAASERQAELEVL